MFNKYLELGSVPKLYKFLKLNNYRTRTEKYWTHGVLYKLLSHQFYIGKLPYKGDIYEGLHEGIIPKDIFRKVQELLANNRNDHKVKVRAEDKSILAGLLYDDNGNKFYPIHSTKKNNVRYRYYQNKAISKKQLEKVKETNENTNTTFSTLNTHIQEYETKMLGAIKEMESTLTEIFTPTKTTVEEATRQTSILLEDLRNTASDIKNLDNIIENSILHQEESFKQLMEYFIDKQESTTDKLVQSMGDKWDEIADSHGNMLDDFVDKQKNTSDKIVKDIKEGFTQSLEEQMLFNEAMTKALDEYYKMILEKNTMSLDEVRGKIEKAMHNSILAMEDSLVQIANELKKRSIGK